MCFHIIIDIRNIIMIKVMIKMKLTNINIKTYKFALCMFYVSNSIFDFVSSSNNVCIWVRGLIKEKQWVWIYGNIYNRETVGQRLDFQKGKLYA